MNVEYRAGHYSLNLGHNETSIKSKEGNVDKEILGLRVKNVG